MTSLVNIYFKHDLNKHELYKNNYTLDVILEIYEDDDSKSAITMKQYLMGCYPRGDAKEYFNYLILAYKIQI